MKIDNIIEIDNVENLDYNTILRRVGNRKVVNQDVVNLKDRDILDVVLNCYSNLKFCRLAAYSVGYCNTSSEFKAVYKPHIDKMYGLQSNKLKNTSTVDEKYNLALGLTGVKETLDIQTINNDYLLLRLVYILDPINELINEQYLPCIINNTLDMYDAQIELYEHKVAATKSYLKNLKKKYDKLVESGKIKIDMTKEDNHADLFIREQSVLVPLYHNNGKYTINGIHYYGVFNNCDNSTGLSSTGKYGAKVFNRKSGKMDTKWFSIIDNVLVANNYDKGYHNVAHFLTEKAVKDTPYEDIFPATDNPLVENIFRRTYNHAIALEDNSIELDNYRVPDVHIPDNIHLGVRDDDFIDTIRRIIDKYMTLLQSSGDISSIRRFEFLGNLEQEIYTVINGGLSMRKGSIDTLKPRINLGPLDIIKVIKAGASESTKNALFTSTSVEPNPFDIFYLFGFIRSTPHTTNKANIFKPGTGPRISTDEKRIKYDDMKYLGEFCPKSESNIGIATTLRLGIDSKCIVTRELKS